MYPINAELSITVIFVEEFCFKAKANKNAISISRILSFNENFKILFFHNSKEENITSLFGVKFPLHMALSAVMTLPWPELM